MDRWGTASTSLCADSVVTFVGLKTTSSNGTLGKIVECLPNKRYAVLQAGASIPISVHERISKWLPYLDEQDIELHTLYEHGGLPVVLHASSLHESALDTSIASTALHRNSNSSNA